MSISNVNSNNKWHHLWFVKQMFWIQHLMRFLQRNPKCINITHHSPCMTVRSYWWKIQRKSDWVLATCSFILRKFCESHLNMIRPLINYCGFQFHSYSDCRLHNFTSSIRRTIYQVLKTIIRVKIFK